MSHRTIRMTDPLDDYLATVGFREPEILARLRAETAELGGVAEMQISPVQGQLMALLVRLMGARAILEVGTFTGYSSLAMALALPAEGRITACDVSEEWTAVGRRYWAEAGVADRIDLRIAPALETLASLRADGFDGTYDIVFIDADKPNYGAYVEAALGLLRTGGLMMVDNVLWGGSVADATDDRPNTVAIRRLNERLVADERLDLCLVPIGDGLTLARKR